MEPKIRLIHGDCLEAMQTMPADHVDSIVTDPPYGLSFMGKNWDHGVPGEAFWTEALRVAKPGAHLLAFGGDRTHHRLMVAIEDAGWEIRTCVYWGFGAGFPKSLNVSKAIDKMAGAKVSAPATEAAKKWGGFGTALKPAVEIIVMARKPLEGTVAGNVLKWGTGALNIDGCRVGTDAGWSYPNGRGGKRWMGRETLSRNLDEPMQSNAGRWPATLIHDNSAAVVGMFPVSGSSSGKPTNAKRQRNKGLCNSSPGEGVYAVDNYGDSGSAARFFQSCPFDDEDIEEARLFYCGKATKRDRDQGCEGLVEKRGGSLNMRTDGHSIANGIDTGPRRNHHPTCKPTSLMRYLVRLVTPPGGVVLDPFAGSGSTGKAAFLEGFGFIGIEKELEYYEIMKCRVGKGQMKLL